jgi:hypothetical protein
MLFLKTAGLTIAYKLFYLWVHKNIETACASHKHAFKSREFYEVAMRTRSEILLVKCLHVRMRGEWISRGSQLIIFDHKRISSLSHVSYHLFMTYFNTFCKTRPTRQCYQGLGSPRCYIHLLKVAQIVGSLFPFCVIFLLFDRGVNIDSIWLARTRVGSHIIVGKTISVTISFLCHPVYHSNKVCDK